MPFPENSITGEYGTMSAYRKKNGLQAHSGTDWAPAGSIKKNILLSFYKKYLANLMEYRNLFF